ncbi:hypothetical protein LJB93_00640 [Desulfovibrio sp. OttesenSCG-928-F07]|nr:hypothetical protein [Desulfovibrio sp. OttesenSCG-928-F07]
MANLMRLDKELNNDLRVNPPVFEPNGESPFKGLSFVPMKAGNPSPAPARSREVISGSNRGFGPCYMVLHHERVTSRPYGIVLMIAGIVFIYGVIFPPSLWGLLLVVPGVFLFVRSFFTIKFMRYGLTESLMGITVRRLRYDEITGMRQYMRGYQRRIMQSDIIAWLEEEQSDYDAGKRVGDHAWWSVDLKVTNGEPLTLSVKSYPGMKQAVVFWLDNMA